MVLDNRRWPFVLQLSELSRVIMPPESAVFDPMDKDLVRQESLGKGEANAETFRWDPAGNQSRPAELGQRPEASLAWCRGDPGCEA
jgi:hypothetical protein